MGRRREENDKGDNGNIGRRELTHGIDSSRLGVGSNNVVE
jgi:hypothetical protein